MLLAMLLPTAFMIVVVFATVFVACVIPTIYSYRLYKKKEKSGEEDAGDSDQ